MSLVSSFAAVRQPPAGAEREGSDSSEEEEDEREQHGEGDAAEAEKRRLANRRKKANKRRSRLSRRKAAGVEEAAPARAHGSGEVGPEPDDDVHIEYVVQMPDLAGGDAHYQQFAKVFEAFSIGEPAPPPLPPVEPTKADDVKPESADEAKKGADALSEAHTKAAIVERILQQELAEKKTKESAEDEEKISKRKLKEKVRPSIADLKASCQRPDVVEWHDVTSREPKLLVHLKSLRNTVPVPRHWCFKRKYLAGKRGIERAPFILPEFIKRTGIMEMRSALLEKEEEKTLKAKQRERVRPKLGKIDIDYQKLHDAFFRHQTKPKMSTLGDLYYEGKEFETQMREKKPGELSDDLRIALGMPVGPNARMFPPPWLIAMQRYGPPPSYPNLKIAGLNAPIPESCAFGYQQGGWGKPPVDEFGKPLYGDVFGIEMPAAPPSDADDAIERSHWGEMDDESDEEPDTSDEEGGGEDGAEGEEDETGTMTPHTEGMITPSGMTSGLATGMETPESIELRKRRQAAGSMSGVATGEDPTGGTATTSMGAETPASLYQVLHERKTERQGGQIMGSQHVYDVPPPQQQPQQQATTRKEKPIDAGVEVALNPDELDLSDPKGLARKYEEGLRAKRGDDGGEDLSDMVAEHAARQKRKRKVAEEKKTKDSTKEAASTSKKYKDFKF